MKLEKKEIYENPEVKIINFTVEDIITASGDGDDTELDGEM